MSYCDLGVGGWVGGMCMLLPHVGDDGLAAFCVGVGGWERDKENRVFDNQSLGGWVGGWVGGWTYP